MEIDVKDMVKLIYWSSFFIEDTGGKNLVEEFKQLKEKYNEAIRQELMAMRDYVEAEDQETSEQIQV